MGKICPKCKTFKTYDNFHKCSQNKSGYKSYCKDCVAIYNKARLKRLSSTEQEKPTSKVCPQCNLELSSDEFHVTKCLKGGLA